MKTTSPTSNIHTPTSSTSDTNSSPSKLSFWFPWMQSVKDFLKKGGPSAVTNAKISDSSAGQKTFLDGTEGEKTIIRPGKNTFYFYF